MEYTSWIDIYSSDLAHVLIFIDEYRYLVDIIYLRDIIIRAETIISITRLLDRNFKRLHNCWR